MINPIGYCPSLHDESSPSEMVNAVSLNVDDPEIDRLACALARLTGESMAEAVRTALAERLERERLRRGQPKKGIAERLNELALECAALPDYDARSPDEIVGYDEHGRW